LWVPFCCALGLTFGCGKRLDDTVDTNKAGEVLQTALDAWKQGAQYGSLHDRQPPIYFAEREWEAGKKLVDYRLGTVELMGRQARCTVKLVVQDGTGKTTERQIGYQIDTIPQAVITREGMGP